ncbi:MAG: hypothetical protein KJ893_02425 [Candidatus Omnitrophica bacterium]|nr:hypothetical protein [Candidatus Omnitrophota bacterium]MBU4478176.1 hypothetical protein [Candidatus Omnitrophota bacterium]MCG2703828.1 hypothetical protein [Candidatus Omnitrophota bacterium]
MIVPMKKITALIFHKEKDAFLSALQDLGVVHISLEKKDTGNESLQVLEKNIERMRTFLNAAKKQERRLPDNSGSAVVMKKDSAAVPDTFSSVEAFEKIKDEISVIDDRIEKMEREIRNLAPWGDFSRESIKRMNDIGINVRFFISPLKKFKQYEQAEIICEEIFRDKTYAYFVVFEQGESSVIDCDEFFYPDTDFPQLETEYMKLQAEKAREQEELEAVFSRAAEVQAYYNARETELSFLTTSSSLSSAVENTVYILSGWVPYPVLAETEKFLQEKDVYFYFSKPQPGEPVPILLRNNRFARLFEPITKMFALPQYAELDLTAFFAPFFTLFFGFCLGDAGYGLIIVIAALIARGKLTADKRPITSLLMILGASTFLFGLISGNLFGVDLSKLPGIRKIVIFDQMQLFNAALILGVIQVFLGMFLKALNRIRQFGFMSSLSSFGWIIMLGGLLGLSFFRPSIWVVYFGMLLILLFNDLKSNIFVRLGKGAWELYGITGVFGDVLSYIRLFALGISSSILGFVVNDIAMQCRGVPFVGYLLTFVILIIGHTGNLLLSALSSFVHPLRLTFVEFYKNAGFEGGGKAYAPFRQIK